MTLSPLTPTPQVDYSNTLINSDCVYSHGEKMISKEVKERQLRKKLGSMLEAESHTVKGSVISDALDSENIETYFSDLLEHGCVSGMIGHLIYYVDTVKFYDAHESEIEDLLDQTREEMGYSNRFEMIGSLNGADNVGDMTQEKNLLTWFAFEETARRLADEIGLEV